MDLYGMLGLDRTASTEDVKRAYRKKAKTEHPDAGGSQERFTALTVAHRILSDKDKRAKYDQHGTTTDEPDRRQAQALELVMSIIEAMIAQPDAVYSDLVAFARQVINTRIGEHRGAIASANADIERVTKMRKRFSAKKGKGDRIGMMLESKVDAIRHSITHIEEALEICNMALAVVDDHTFQADAQPTVQTYQWAGTSTLGNIFGR